MVSSVYQPPGFDIEAAKTIRAVTGSIPLMAHGKLNHPDTAEEALESGAVDLIAIGHGLIADPYWPNKVKKGLLDEVNPCIGCGECHFNSMKGWPRPCAVNPEAMHETEYTLEPVKEKKRILVLGGGPGGMKAAATAAQRGFDVTLWEKKNRLGGAMAAAGAPDFKKDVRDQVAYLIRQLDKYGVHVELGKEASLDEVKAFAPDFTVVATRCDPIIIPVPGKDKPIVKTAIPVFLNEEKTGDNVVIIGGGDVGCELACDLSMKGKKVTIVEMLDKVMARGGSFVANEQNLRYLLKNSGTEIICSARLTEILDDGVKYIKDGTEHVLNCDTVVFAAGFRPDQRLYESIADAGLECVQVGDNVRMGKIIDAIHQGYNSMRVLEL
jgi:2-enoate reductase